MPSTLPKTTQPAIEQATEKNKDESNIVSFDFSSEEIEKLRRALIFDLGKDMGWSDDDVRNMALDTLHAIEKLVIIREEQQEQLNQ